MNIPADLKYTKSHEWVKIEGDVVVTGITDYAQSELGDVVFIDINEGVEAQIEDPIGTIEAVKTVADVFSPVTGKVIEINNKVKDSPETVNKDPYGEGWLAKISVKIPAELDSLLDAAAYKALIGQ
jgi:glycine cleavage system H protein